jgi:broad specificity phosphatase PhoE
MKTVHFVRHGETVANTEGIISGEELDTELTETGVVQAEARGEDLKGEDIELIVATPLKRTIITANIIARIIGYKGDIVPSELFIERSYGKYSGRPNEEFKNASITGIGLETVETTKAMYERIQKGLEWLRQQEEERIALVSHAGVYRMLRTIHQGLSHEYMYRVGRLPNGEVYEFTL